MLFNLPCTSTIVGTNPFMEISEFVNRGHWSLYIGSARSSSRSSDYFKKYTMCNSIIMV